MRILAFVDLHGDFKALKKIVQDSGKADILVCAGDISTFQQHLNGLLSLLNRAKSPVLIIPGNHESPETLRHSCLGFENLIFMHKKTFVFEDALFLGYGTGGFSMRYENFRRTAKNFSKSIKRHPDKKVVLITHAPPFNTKLDLICKEHRGNVDIKNFIQNNRVDILICGHLHENSGKQDKMRNTLIVNPGAMKFVWI